MKKTIFILISIVIFAFIRQTLHVEAAEKKAGQEIFGIGSVSKIFTAAAVMKLSDAGRIELDTPVTSYLPQFQMADERYQDITVRMLLNHSSGIMGTTNNDCFLYGKADTDYHQILLDSLKNQMLKADPGEYSVYCNDGFTLAEMIVEQVSGISFEQFIDREFSIPLGLKNTFTPEAISGKENLAPVYYNDSRLPYENIKSLGSGGIYSTPEDLCLFAEIFTEDGKKLLSKKSADAMAAPEYKTNKICVQDGDSNFNYGLGWDSVEVYPFSRYGIKALSKGGDTGNYGAGLIVLPEQNLSAAVTISGGESFQSLIMAQKIISEVLKEEGLISEEEELSVTAADTSQKGIPIPEALYKYQGIYASGGIWKLEFTGQNTARITSLENNSEMVQEYLYTGEGNFCSTGGGFIYFTGLAKAAGGVGGITSFHFSEESNGKTYMLGTTYTLSEGKKTSAITMPFAEKITENSLEESVRNAWEKRDGKKYYLVSEGYASSYYLKTPSLKIELMNQLSGYLGASVKNNIQNFRITDSENAVCELDLPVMLGRDLKKYRFYREEGDEFLEEGGFTYIEESAIPDFPESKAEITAGLKGQWYRINEKQAGSSIRIEAPDQAACFIFDKNDICIAGTQLLDTADSLILPRSGKILLVGESGSSFRIIR